MLIIVISTVVIVMVKRLPYLFVGWLWYAITIAPVIGIIQVSKDAIRDGRPLSLSALYRHCRYAGLGNSALIKSEDIRKKILFPAGIIFLAIMAVLTWQQCGYWKNSINLFSHALQVTKNNYLAHDNYGLALFEEGKY